MLCIQLPLTCVSICVSHLTLLVVALHVTQWFSAKYILCVATFANPSDTFNKTLYILRENKGFHFSGGSN